MPVRMRSSDNDPLDDSLGGPPRRVVVAMSGGVDSSVVAALMKRAGHDVIGVTLQLYDHGSATGRKGSCCAGQDIHDARRVADRIGIPHYVLDYEQRFSDLVMQPFADSYATGETPIPCVTCNQEVKFGSLLDTAQDLGADVLATGHYVDLRHGPHGPELYRAVDGSRDQSYFLFRTNRSQLAKLAFPLGGLPKSRVRELAQELDLPVASKPDSQDICFVPSGRYASTIERMRPDAAEPGDIVDVDGRVLGRHDGIFNFTIGQRRGLGISSSDPLFVIKLDAARRRVVVGPRAYLLIHALQLRDFNWLGDAPIEHRVRDGGLPVHVRVRSTAAPAPATLLAESSGYSVRLQTGELGVAPGQACVLYADGAPRSRVLGGGFIASTTRYADEARSCSQQQLHPSTRDGMPRMMA